MKTKSFSDLIVFLLLIFAAVFWGSFFLVLLVVLPVSYAFAHFGWLGTFVFGTIGILVYRKMMADMLHTFFVEKTR